MYRAPQAWRRACFIKVTSSSSSLPALFFGAGHGINFRRIVYSAIDVIHSKGER
jgi:hypothetical protein